MSKCHEPYKEKLMAIKKLESQRLSFTFDGKTIENIECNIEVNDDSQWGKIDVHSKDINLVSIQDQQSVDVRIVHTGDDEEIIKLTEINKASVRGFSIAFGSAGALKFSLYPKEVLIHQRVSPARGKRKAILKYYINKAPMISPHYRLIPNEQGVVKRSVGHSFIFNLDSEIKTSSEVCFSYSLKGDHFESDRYQLLEINFRKKKDNIEYVREYITPKINDFLMLSSLLHDNRVTFTSWRVECDGMFTWYYKSQAIKPKAIDETSIKELIESKYLEEFINSCLPRYQSSEYKTSIDNAIHTLMLNGNNIIELSFLSYFQALESMILTYKRLTHSEFNLTNIEFRKLRRSIEKVVSAEIPDNTELRSKIKNKLGELNRVSLKDSAKDFYLAFGINCENTWPLFDDKTNGITGLVTLRNVLIHGDLLPSDKLRSIYIACQHLRILLLRFLFSLLGWDITKTKVRSDYLKSRNNLFEEKTLKEAIDDIHSYFANK